MDSRSCGYPSRREATNRAPGTAWSRPDFGAEALLGRGPFDRHRVDIGIEAIGRRRMADPGVQELTSLGLRDAHALVPVEHEVGAVHAVDVDRFVERRLVPGNLVDAVCQWPASRGSEAAIEVRFTADSSDDVGNGDRRLRLEARMPQAEAPSDLVEHEEVAAAAGSAESHGRSVPNPCRLSARGEGCVRGRRLA